MTLSLEPIESERPAHVVFDNASWEFYEHLLKEIGDGTTRVTYDQGRMEIMSPLPKHDRSKRLIGKLIDALAEELQIPIAAYGSTTFKSEVLQRGLEPDEAYYIENEARMRLKDRIDLDIDPPPDMVVEIDITYRSVKREPIYAEMGVPEIWRYDGTKIECLLLDASKEYVVVERSRSFPHFRPAELTKFLAMLPAVDELRMVAAFRVWLRQLAH